MEPDEEIDALAERLGRTLAARGLTVATAESCTGGLVAGAITSVAGSSTWFGEGYVTYANEAKRRLVGVPDATLEAHGAVSEATVRAMALGALERSGADVALAVSGIAGPGGEVAGKPVGTVWLAVATRVGTGGEARDPRGDGARAGEGVGGAGEARVEASLHRFDGDRARVRRGAVVEGLRATLSALS